jgi:hypothetical protein
MKNSKSEPASSVVNFNIPPEVFAMFRAPPAIPVPSTPVASTSASAVLMLLPPGGMLGPRLSLEEFCMTYDVSDGVRKRLDENGYNGSHMFCYAEIQDLKDAGFKAGEIAQLKDAISRWAA